MQLKWLIGHCTSTQIEIPKIAKPNLNHAAEHARVLEQKLISLTQSCKTRENLLQIHSHIITTAAGRRTHLLTSHFLSACSRLGLTTHARQVFDQLSDRHHTSLWNVLSKGYLYNNSHHDVILLFADMMRENVNPNCYTLPVVLKSCSKRPGIKEGEQVHCLAVKNGFKSNTYVGTNLIEFYSSAGHVGLAYQVFKEMVIRNVVSWTAMINGYLANRDLVSARRLFDLSPERDIILWNRMITGYTESGDMAEARRLFDSMPGKDLMSFNTLLHGYANNGYLEECEVLFESIREKNIFSWNGLIAGYARNARFLEVIRTFERMLGENDVKPNDATLVHVLAACSKLGALDFGKWVHAYSEENGYGKNLYVCNGLADMYAKCGLVERAIRVFRGMNKRDLISWNTIINALAVHGHGSYALEFFDEMKKSGERPDGITFIGIISACSHLGLVKTGLSYFRSMSDDVYSIEPKIEHYGCVVDLLARNGLVEEAMDFVHEMPLKADGVIWTAILASARIHKKIEFAEVALRRLMELDPKNPANYVMLSNVYGEARKWDGLARLKVAVRDMGSRKVPGVSSIELDGEIHEFYAFDERHAESEGIYRVLKGLTEMLRLCECDGVGEVKLGHEMWSG
ncbi:pentatricopeptide repeat-containing protein [Striga asiatica]|uniref:Pentatricopeptide repeat-containing protein n=1 Tax=Striga asiatica TaxID=4170 RepID=A0A5A7P743_STRAF|nr:pentatricopeptide repeat-containing protein [Striga asiatica]